ncbi:hypothetical protein ACWDE9_21480, partial [Streptomyces olivaceoviridis]
MSDTTDLMGARVEETAAAPATDASAPATGAGSRRRRGTGLEGMVLAPTGAPPCGVRPCSSSTWTAS